MEKEYRNQMSFVRDTNYDLRYAFIVDTSLNDDPLIINFISYNDDPIETATNFFESHEAKNKKIHYSKFSKLIKHGLEDLDRNFDSSKFIFYFSSTYFLDPLELRSCIIELAKNDYYLECYGYNDFSIEAFNKMENAFTLHQEDGRHFTVHSNMDEKCFLARHVQDTRVVPCKKRSIVYDDF